ncbi:class II aldolase/adducin family protein [Streptomyces sp. 8L]|uniref:class II aldolase/adducin family protein n=1 Tax=Streptomyces sp. 8L TaxID=2877242 RepID=UPI001CD48CBC|nr:class II aldolase/adducin family protein [Streptomyces sp. 8L]MCA1219717.1 class II aldolase/adducin family protein [Streptomyces sp. 8L]
MTGRGQDSGTGGPRGDLVEAGARLHRLGFAPGASGNLSVRDGDRVLITPTGCELGALRPQDLCVLGLDGTHLDGPRPSKEFPLHTAFYRRDPDTTAVVHLHARQAAAVSCRPAWSERSAIPPLTPYFVMRVGQTPLIPYAAPGDPGQAALLESLPFPFRAALLQNHGPVVSGRGLESALDAAIELEEVCALLLLLSGHGQRHLSPPEIEELTARYKTPWDL